MIIMKKFLVVLLALCMVFSFAACGGNTDNGGAASGDGIVDVCLASEPQSIDPALNSAVDGAIMIQHAFEGLIKWVNDGEGNAVLAPGMAESWDVDGTTWTFHIRENATWSDGQPVTANDFVYSWNRLVNPETAADYEYMVDMVKGYDEHNLAISAPDDHTFVVELSTACPYFEEICAFPATFPVRQDIVEEYGDQWTFDTATYVSNGPYVMTEWQHNGYILMSKNEAYYDADAYTTPQVKFHLMDDANAMLAGFRNGQLDFIEEVPQDEIQALLQSGDLKVDPYIGTYYVCFQTQKAPFDDARVRKAFSLAIDRNYIINQVTGRGEVVATGYVPAGIYDAEGPAGDDFRTVGGDYYTVDDEGYQARCDEARQLLAEAGYPNGEGFPVVEYLYNTNDNHKAIGEALQNMWQTELGVTVSLNNQDWAVFLDTRKNGDYSIARNGWIADYNDPMSFIDMWMTGGGNNDAQYANPAYDALVKKAKTTDVAADRMNYMHQAEDILIGEDSVLAPIYFYVNTKMVAEGLDGIYYTPLGYYFFGQCSGF